MVQKDIGGVKQFTDAAKTIPEMITKIVPAVINPPKALDGKPFTDTKRLDIYNYHKTIVDSILLKVNSL